MPPREPPTTIGKLAGNVAGREETTEGPPNELYVEINEGTKSIPEDCVEVEAKKSKPREDQTLPPCLSSRQLNLEGKTATEGAIPRELLKLPLLTRFCPAEKQVDLAVKLGC